MAGIDKALTLLIIQYLFLFRCFEGFHLQTEIEGFFNNVMVIIIFLSI